MEWLLDPPAVTFSSGVWKWEGEALGMGEGALWFAF